MSEVDAQDTSPTLEDLGLYPVPEGDQLIQEVFARGLIEAEPVSPDDIDETFSNIDDLAWLADAARDNRCILVGESHYGRYIENITNRILFAVNTYDHYHLLVQELQFSLTAFANYYLDIEDEETAALFLDTELRSKLFCEDFYSRLIHIRRWNRTHTEKQLHVGFSDIEHDYRTTIGEILIPYFRRIEPDFSLDLENLQAAELDEVLPDFRELLSEAREAGLIGEYPFITPDYIETVIDNLESTWLAKLDRIMLVHYRQKAIIRNLTDPRFLGEYFEQGKVMLWGGYYHMQTGIDYPLDANFLKEGSYLTYEYEPTMGRTFSIVLDGFGFSLGGMADIDLAECGHQGSGYTYFVETLQKAREAGLISPDDWVALSEPDAFTLYLLDVTGNLTPALFTWVDMDGLLTAAETDRSLLQHVKDFRDMYIYNDAYILAPCSPLVIAIRQPVDE